MARKTQLLILKSKSLMFVAGCAAKRGWVAERGHPRPAPPPRNVHGSFDSDGSSLCISICRRSVTQLRFQRVNEVHGNWEAQLKIAGSVRPTFGSFHDMASSPSRRRVHHAHAHANSFPYLFTLTAPESALQFSVNASRSKADEA